MALNWKTFRTRSLTAAVFVAVMLTGLLWNAWSFLLLFTVIHFGCWWEYGKLLEKIYQTSIHIYSRIGWMLLGYRVMLWFAGPVYQLSGYGVRENLTIPLTGAAVVFLVMGIFQQNRIHLGAYAASFLGLLYISLAMGLMLDLHATSLEFVVHDATFLFSAGLLPLLLIASIWINDTMAYIVGSLIGKTPLSPVSPKKTWEGTLGGILLAVLLVGYLFPLLAGKPAGIQMLGFLAPVVAVAAISGTFGDLLESKLKRLAGVKDSGNFMPGHGGFLDRFDSLLLAIPFVWVYLEIFWR